MNNGLFYRFFAFFVIALSSLVSMSATAQTIAKIETKTNSLLTNQQVSKSNVPLRVRGGAYSSNRLKSSSRKKFTQRNISKVRLRSKSPRQLGITNYDVLWKIKDLKRRNVQTHRGKVTNVQLPPGKYRVTMQIGKYKQSKIIRVRKSRNTVQSFSMPIKAGLLKVGSGKGAMGNARIKVRNSAGKVVASSKGRPIKQLLRSGKYTVEVAYGNKKKGRNVVHVRNGAVKVANVRLPASGKVRLRAFEKGKRPLMKSSKWVIYNSAGKKVYSTKRHTLR
ncbi:MAG: hypothetical protein V3U87_05920, partial [Methylococcaceae bacterium]